MTYKIESDQRGDMSQEAEAVKEQHNILGKRIRLFGRTTLWQGFLLLCAAYFPYLAGNGGDVIVRPLFRAFLGQPVLNGLLGIVMILLYAGIRKHNLLCGSGALFVSFMAAICSPLLRAAYEITDYVDAWMPKLFVYIFLFIYLIPFSILVIQFPPFWRWKKLKDRYGDAPGLGADGLFPEKGFRPGLVMVIWAVLLCAGGWICIQDEVSYRQAWDISGWDRCTLNGTTVSMLMPRERREEAREDGGLMLTAGGDRLIVGLVNMEFFLDQGGLEEEQLTELSQPKDGTMEGDIAYHQTAMREERFGTAVDLYTRTFRTGGREYACFVMVLGRTDSQAEEKVEAVFDSIQTSQ